MRRAEIRITFEYLERLLPLIAGVGTCPQDVRIVSANGSGYEPVLSLLLESSHFEDLPEGAFYPRRETLRRDKN